MAKSHETGDRIVNADNPISDVLSAPPGPDWTIDRLAEQVLSAIALQGPKAEQNADEFVLDVDLVTDRQSQRLLRPLLACLANKSAAEAGTSPALYQGRLSFERRGADGPVWVVGEFENRPGSVRVRLRRSNSPPATHESPASQLNLLAPDDLRPGDAPPTTAARPLG